MNQDNNNVNLPTQDETSEQGISRRQVLKSATIGLGALALGGSESAEAAPKTQSGLPPDQAVVIVPPGQAQNIHIVEGDPSKLHAEITVRVSKLRQTQAVPVLGVIVK